MPEGDRPPGAGARGKSGLSAADREEQYVTVRGLRLHVVTCGRGSPLLLINGIGANLDMWAPFVEHLDGRRVILFDAPGTGKSGTPGLPLSMYQLAGVVADLLDAVGEDAVDVLGFSYGSALAQQFARRHPARVRRLVLAAATYGIGAVPGRASFLLASPSRYYSQRLFRSLAPHLYGGRLRARHDLLDKHAEARLSAPPGPLGYSYQVLSILSWTSLPWLSSLLPETLVLAADGDPVCPVINARILARLIPRATLTVVRGGGHLFLMDDAENVTPIVLRFLDACSDSAEQPGRRSRGRADGKTAA